MRGRVVLLLIQRICGPWSSPIKTGLRLGMTRILRLRLSRLTGRSGIVDIVVLRMRRIVVVVVLWKTACSWTGALGFRFLMTNDRCFRVGFL